jgi:hypothetical protein
VDVKSEEVNGEGRRVNGAAVMLDSIRSAAFVRAITGVFTVDHPPFTIRLCQNHSPFTIHVFTLHVFTLHHSLFTIHSSPFTPLPKPFFP